MNHLDMMATSMNSERREGETDEELRSRLLARFARFRNNFGTLYDVVHVAEQAILHESPVGLDMGNVRCRVALGLLSKNRPESIWSRLVLACRAFVASL
jgi:hypothetical protein